MDGARKGKKYAELVCAYVFSGEREGNSIIYVRR